MNTKASIDRSEESAVWHYFAVYGALLALTVLTVGASLVDLGRFGGSVALGIALLKAMLVALFFMHLRRATRLLPLVAAASLFWLALLLLGIFSDYLMRGFIR